LIKVLITSSLLSAICWVASLENLILVEGSSATNGMSNNLNNNILGNAANNYFGGDERTPCRTTVGTTPLGGNDACLPLETMSTGWRPW